MGRRNRTHRHNPAGLLNKIVVKKVQRRHVAIREQRMVDKRCSPLSFDPPADTGSTALPPPSRR